jgi:hypothetical protein
MLNIKKEKLVFLIVVALLFLITVLCTDGKAKDISLYRDCLNLPVMESPVLEFLDPEDEVRKLFRIVGMTSYHRILEYLIIIMLCCKT